MGCGDAAGQASPQMREVVVCRISVDCRTFRAPLGGKSERQGPNQCQLKGRGRLKYEPGRSQIRLCGK